MYQQRQILTLQKEIEELRLVNKMLARVGLKTWVHLAMLKRDFGNFVDYNYFPLLQTFGEAF